VNDHFNVVKAPFTGCVEGFNTLCLPERWTSLGWIRASYNGPQYPKPVLANTLVLLFARKRIHLYGKTPVPNWSRTKSDKSGGFKKPAPLIWA